jgi:hypothetical protein
MMEIDEWKRAHRELAAMLGATDRGRDHCDAMLVVAALKSAFHVASIRVLPDASEVQITTADGTVHSIPATKEIT